MNSIDEKDNMSKADKLRADVEKRVAKSRSMVDKSHALIAMVIERLPVRSGEARRQAPCADDNKPDAPVQD